MLDRTLFVGIGSPHGDDQVGWLVVDEVSRHCGAACRQARTPVELLDWLDGIEKLVLCDAMASDRPVGWVTCWSWPALELARVAFRGSHDLVGSSRVDLQACKLEYSIVSPK